MRNDANHQPDPDSPGAPPADQPRPATPPGRGWAPGIRLVKVPALLALVAATSWVVGHWVSTWLVPIYLGVMALILCPSAEATRRRRATSRGQAPGPDLADDRPATPDAGGDESPPTEGSSGSTAVGEAASLPADGDGSGPAAATATKPKRTRSRARKPSKPTAEPVEVAAATWVEVGPGKFVRAETPAPSAPVAGPHLAVDPTPELPGAADPVPSEVPDPLAIPSGPTGRDEVVAVAAIPGLDVAFFPAEARAPLGPEPAADSLAGTDDAVGAPALANDVPISAAAEAWSLPVADVAEGMFAPGLDFRAPTVDGTALQVDGPEGPVYEEEPPFDDAATGDDLAPPDDADWPPPDSAEPFGSADLDAWDDLAATAAAPIEPTWPDDDESAAEPDPWDDHAAAVMDADPSRDHAPDVADDFDPAEGHPEPGIASADDWDASPAVPDVSPGDDHAGRPQRPPIVRLARVAARRGPARGAHDGRPGRSPRPSRRPTSSRRPTRRRVGRSGPIIRSARPRSPPRGGRGGR